MVLVGGEIQTITIGNHTHARERACTYTHTHTLHNTQCLSLMFQLSISLISTPKAGLGYMWWVRYLPWGKKFKRIQKTSVIKINNILMYYLQNKIKCKKIHVEQNIEIVSNNKIQPALAQHCLTCPTLILALVPVKCYLPKQGDSPWAMVCQVNFLIYCIKILSWLLSFLVPL